VPASACAASSPPGTECEPPPDEALPAPTAERGCPAPDENPPENEAERDPPEEDSFPAGAECDPPAPSGGPPPVGADWIRPFTAAPARNGPLATESACDRSLAADPDGPLSPKPAGSRPPVAGAANRCATAAVRPAIRLPCRARKPAGAASDLGTGDPAAPAGEPVALPRTEPAALPRTGPAAGALPAARLVAGCCSACARRIASVRRSAVAGPGADSNGPGTARPVGTPTGDATPTDDATPTAGARRAAVARATERRSAAATPAPLGWETAPALAARAGVGSPLPVSFPGGPADDDGAEEAEAPGGGVGRGACNRRCSCELVIGPAATTSSIRRTGIAVETRPPAMVPGERGWSSVGTCRAARASPRGGNGTAAGTARPADGTVRPADGPTAGTARPADGTAESTSSESTASSGIRGVHQRGGRTSACPSERAETVAAAASARRTPAGRAVPAANRAEDSAIRPRPTGRARPGRPGRRSRWATDRPSALRSTSPGGTASVLIGSSTGSRGGRPRAVPATPRCCSR